MVSSASRLYDWQASRLGGPHMGTPLRTDSGTSQPDTLRKRACPTLTGIGRVCMCALVERLHVGNRVFVRLHAVHMLICGSAPHLWPFAL